MDEIVRRHDWWERREGLDLWSVPHFLFGVLAAIATPLFSWPILPTFIAILVAGVVWELFEADFLGVDESAQNQVLDVVLSLVGYVVFILVLMANPLSTLNLILVGGGVLGLYLLLNVLGWLAHRRRGKQSLD